MKPIAKNSMKPLKKQLCFCLLTLFVVVGGSHATPVVAQDYVLNMQHFLPERSTIPAKFLTPWARKVERESNNRIKINVFPSMQLGGKPLGLFDQISDGIIDLGWTLPGYNPGRFASVEAFELPFMMTNAPATSRALNAFVDLHGGDDFAAVKVIALHVHGPGLIHAKGEGVRSLEDMDGKRVRGPTRVINALIKKAGATPIGLPVPIVPEALSRGVIDATVIPWEVTNALKVEELTQTHTEFAGDKALYTSTFVFAMNRAKYESLPKQLQQVIDNNSGPETGAWASQMMVNADAPARQVAIDRGNTIVTIDGDELTRWNKVGNAVITDWIAEMEAAGRNGQKMVEDARALIEQQSR